MGNISASFMIWQWVALNRTGSKSGLTRHITESSNNALAWSTWSKRYVRRRRLPSRELVLWKLSGVNYSCRGPNNIYTSGSSSQSTSVHLSLNHPKDHMVAICERVGVNTKTVGQRGSAWSGLTEFGKSIHRYRKQTGPSSMPNSWFSAPTS